MRRGPRTEARAASSYGHVEFGSHSHMKTNRHHKAGCLESHFILVQQYHEKALSPKLDTFLNKPLVKQGNIHLSFQKQRRKEHSCISLGITLDCLFGSNNANRRCSFPLIKKLKADGFFHLFRTKTVCKIYQRTSQTSAHWTGKNEKLNPTTLLYLSSVCKGQGGSGGVETATLKGVTWNYEVPNTPSRKGRHTGAKLTLKNKNTANISSPAIASLSIR